jgi:hypothetical protein
MCIMMRQSARLTIVVALKLAQRGGGDLLAKDDYQVRNGLV